MLNSKKGREAEAATPIRDAIERFESCRRVTRSLPAYNVRSYFHYPLMWILLPFCDQRGMGPPGAPPRSMVGLAQQPGPLRPPGWVNVAWQRAAKSDLKRAISRLKDDDAGPAWEPRTSGST